MNMIGYEATIRFVKVLTRGQALKLIFSLVLECGMKSRQKLN